MDNNERVLHQVLAHCRKPLYQTENGREARQQLENRLEEIELLVEKRVIQNALDKVA